MTRLPTGRKAAPLSPGWDEGEPPTESPKNLPNMSPFIRAKDFLTEFAEKVCPTAPTSRSSVPTRCPRRSKSGRSSCAGGLDPDLSLERSAHEHQPFVGRALDSMHA